MALAIDELTRKYDNARQGANYHGWAVVQAAIDWTRMSVGRPISQHELVALDVDQTHGAGDLVGAVVPDLDLDHRHHQLAIQPRRDRGEPLLRLAAVLGGFAFGRRQLRNIRRRTVHRLALALGAAAAVGADADRRLCLLRHLAAGIREAVSPRAALRRAWRSCPSPRSRRWPPGIPGRPPPPSGPTGSVSSRPGEAMSVSDRVPPNVGN